MKALALVLLGTTAVTGVAAADDAGTPGPPPAIEEPDPSSVSEDDTDDTDDTDASSSPDVGAPLAISGEVLAGAAGGFVGLLVGGAVGGTIEQAISNCGGSFCGLVGAMIGGYATATLTVPVGVYLVGRGLDQRGSLAATYAGSLVGGALGAGAVAYAAHARNDTSLGVAAVFALAAPIAGAVIGYNLSRGSGDDQPPVIPTLQATSEQTSFGLVGQF